MEADTKLCSKCGETKEIKSFIINKLVCKECRNKYTRTRYNAIELLGTKVITCVVCEESKPDIEFVKNRTVCKDCNNKQRRKRYQNNPEHRKRLIEQASKFKQAKIQERAVIREADLKALEEKIGSENTICKYCKEVKPKTRFRHNRKKCADCERDEPMEKLKRLVRSRICGLLNKNKSKHTIEYLGCDADNYIKWLQFNDSNYILDNRGVDWHIDHVIPLSKFNLEDEEEQLIAFNWRNTTALSPQENLSKNNKIIPEQIEEHLQKLIIYHEENNIELPQNYIDLFAKHLDAGSPLEPIQSNKLENHYQVCNGN